ncbi:MAG: cytochrome c oxidase subunit II [Parvibaculaceae bacterium]
MSLIERRNAQSRERARRGLLIASFASALSGCSGVQSALDPAGSEAEKVATLFLVMVVGGAMAWILVVGLLAHALNRNGPALDEKKAGKLIFWGGAFLPTTTLAALLAYALWLMPFLRPWSPAGATDTLKIEVVGEQYWWRVTYLLPDGRNVVSANEIRVPVGERVTFTLQAKDVIHSFWIPPFAGKMDMIPGRTNRLTIEANRAGTFRGACAEYCGTSHALMAFPAVAMEADDFRSWLDARTVPSPNVEGRGRDLFLSHGCGACHTVQGTGARGVIGPDLSHIGSRLALGAGVLEISQEQIARFISNPAAVKPGARMPAFGMLPPDDIRAIAVWLEGLK